MIPIVEEKKVPGGLPRKTRFVEALTNNSAEVPQVLFEEPFVVDLDQANVVTSELAYDGLDNLKLHAPVIDLDYPAELIPSSTPGHFHLVLDRAIPWDKYRRLLRALADADLIEEGYAEASLARGYTAIRLPWIKKKPKKEITL